jgi:glycosyltransferase involved in cell wall biosynthesis
MDKKYTIGYEYKNIENISEYNFIVEDKVKPGISAMLRAWNEEEIIQASIISIIDFVDEVVFIDNNSTDNTLQKVKELLPLYPNKIIIESYPFKNVKYGNDFINTDPLSVTSQVYYYNWCKSKCNYSHILKWDADMIVPTNFRDIWISICSELFDGIYALTGRLLIVDLDKNFRDTQHQHIESRIYPNNHLYQFTKIEGQPTEVITFKSEIPTWKNNAVNKIKIETACYYEVKNLGKNEFAHFSNFDFINLKQGKELQRYNEVLLDPSSFETIKDSMLEKIKNINE